MNALLFVVLVAVCVQVATSFSSQIRVRSAITKKAFQPCKALYCTSGPPELQSNDEEPTVRWSRWIAFAEICFDCKTFCKTCLNWRGTGIHNDCHRQNDFKCNSIPIYKLQQSLNKYFSQYLTTQCIGTSIKWNNERQNEERASEQRSWS